jgi:hypothetical protein
MTDPNVAALACARCGAVLADPAGHVCEVDRLRAENERLRAENEAMGAVVEAAVRWVDSDDDDTGLKLCYAVVEWERTQALAPTPAGPR